MKLVKRQLPEELEGHIVSLYPEDDEDMWHTYNLLLPGDILHAPASRKLHLERDGVETNKTVRVRTDMAIQVVRTSFDPITSILRVSGIIVAQSEVGARGAAQSVDLEPHRAFSIIRPNPEDWDSVAQETLQQALSDDKNGALAAVVMQEGLANICLITQFRTIHKTRVESVVPRKRDTSSLQDAGMRRFFDKTLNSLMRAADFTQSRPLLLASPGFVAEDFKKYIASKGRDTSDKVLTGIGNMATVVHASAGHVHSLNEVLQSPEVRTKMKNMRYAKEAQLMDTFFEKLKVDDGRAWYGTKAVTKAVEEGAVGSGGGVLLINHSLFRSMDLDTRRKYVRLVDKVRADGGQTRVLSSDHDSGKRLKMLGDIAAILSYPILDLDEDEEEEEEQGQGQSGSENGRRENEIDEDMLNGVI